MLFRSLADKFAVIRSIRHNQGNHGAGNHYMMTGAPPRIPVGCGAFVSFHPSLGSAVAKLVSENAYYAKATIPGGMYKGTDSNVETFGVGATFVSSTKVSADVVYQVVKAVFADFDSFRKLHPAFANLKQEEMIKDGLSAPLHDGAVRYYKEAGLM